MFKVSFAKAFLFKKIIELTKDFMSEVNVVCGDSEISFNAMDSSSIALISVYLSHDEFEKILCDQHASIDVNLVLLNKILARVNVNDGLTLGVDECKPDILSVHFKSTHGDRKSTYELKLLDINQEQLQIPEVEYPVIIRMPTNDFRIMCQDLMVTGDQVNISLDQNENRVRFISTNDIGDICTVELTANDKTDINAGSDIDMYFSLKYLSDFSKAYVLSEHVRIYLKEDMPILLEYEIRSSYVRYYLAPKVKE